MKRAPLLLSLGLLAASLSACGKGCGAPKDRMLTVPCPAAPEERAALSPPASSARGDVSACLAQAYLKAEDIAQNPIIGQALEGGPGSNVQAVTFSYNTTRAPGSKSPAAVAGAMLLLPEDVKEPGALVVVTHPTLGIASSCAPSQKAPIPLAVAFAAAGYVALSVDYAGYRTEDWPPQFLGAEDEARSIFDAIRAGSRILKDAYKPKKVILAGFSEGGHAVLAAQGLTAAEKLDVPIVGVMAAAPMWFPQRLLGRMTAIPPPPERGQFDALWSLYYFYSQGETFDGPGGGLKPFKKEKEKQIKRWATRHCARDIVEELEQLEAHTLFDPAFVQSLAVCEKGETCAEPGKAWFERFENEPKLDRKGPPVLLVLAGNDGHLTPQRAKCALEDVRRSLDAEKTTVCVDRFSNHFALVGRNMPRIVKWARARFHDEPIPPLGCLEDAALAAARCPAPGGGNK